MFCARSYGTAIYRLPCSTASTSRQVITVTTAEAETRSGCVLSWNVKVQCVIEKGVCVCEDRDTVEEEEEANVCSVFSTFCVTELCMCESSVSSCSREITLKFPLG